MNQKLSDWAGIAEIVSGIAIVFTLVFLFLGIRENTNITRAAVYRDSVDSLNALDSLIAQDPELTNIWTQYQRRDTASLDELETRRLVLLAAQLFRILETTYFNQQYGLFGGSEWDRWETTICSHYEGARLMQVTQFVATGVTAEFMEYMESSCQV